MNQRSDSYVDCVICLVIGAIASYAILSIMERQKFFKEFFVEKFPHEVKRNLAGFFLTAAALEEVLVITTKEPLLINAVIIAWGFGDAVAALVGIPFGKHKLPFGDKKKSMEGSVAFVAVATVLTSIYMKVVMPGVEFLLPIFLVIFIAAIVGAVVEIIAKDKWDNLVVPAAITLVFLILKY
ncbi:MAG: hypothetical protein K5675_00470 [Lachnospiraceae bacterium]|nr:hypothetical protein [Lachnospiraceae bacterium]